MTLSIITETTLDPNISLGSAAAPVITNEYCPNYPFTLDQTAAVLIVTGYDVTNIFYVGRSVSLKDTSTGDADDVVLTSSYDGTNTSLTFNTTGLLGMTDLCLKSSATNWSPIASDPFGGTSINAMTTGEIGGVQYWVAVGDIGKIAVSSNKGQDWSTVASGVTGHLLAVCYNDTNKEFVAIGASTMLRSTDGASFTAIAVDASVLPSYAMVDLIWVATDTKYIMVGSRLSDGLIKTFSNAAADLIAWSAYANLSASANPNLAIELSASGSNIILGHSDKTAWLSSVYDTSFTDVTTTIGAICNDLVNTDLSSYYTLSVWSDGSIKHTTSSNTYSATPRASDLRGVALSELLNRVVFVGTSGYIGNAERADLVVAGLPVTNVPNGFDPLTTINGVAVNDIDGVFIAFASNGQICRSTNGIS